jgi:sugar/nucleoside kinase (ribokinase family)
MRRLGRTASVLGKVGNDLFGDFVLQDLKHLGIDNSFVKRSETHPTSCTFVLNVRGEDRRFVHCVGANSDFSMQDVDEEALEGARALYVGGFLVMPALGSDQLAQLMQQAKRRGLITALDVVIPAFASSSLEDLRAAAFEVACVDESGSGDAFDAGFLVGMLEGWMLEETLRFASAVGASCTRALGCHDGVFRFEEAWAFIAQHPLEIVRIT